MNQRNASSFRSSLLLLLALLFCASVLPACNKAGKTDALAAQIQSDLDYPHLFATDDGRIVVANATPALRRARSYILVPHRWLDGETQPIIGTGRLVLKDGILHAVQFANVQTETLSEMEVVAADDIQPLAGTKIVSRVAALPSETTLQIPITEETGVAFGDLYFILTRDRFSDEPRLGELIGAIARVREIHKDGAILSVIHANDTISVGDPVIFAQARSLDAPPEFSIYTARLGADAAALPAGVLSPLMAAMPEFLLRYELTSIAVENLDTYIDPRPWDAAVNAGQVPPDYRWGVVVFGDIEPGKFIYNATGFGPAPDPDSTVGILAGGLPLAYDGDLSTLSAQLVPSFIANGLGMRGDHALAVYILENELRTQRFDPLVRYHLREHLALRYDSLNATAEALRIINHDIAQATQKNETYPLLNALSIRSHLSSSSGLARQWLDDTERFVQVGEGVLPADSLDAERTQMALALLYNQRLKDAETLATEVAARAEARADQRLRFSALLSLARIQLANEQPEAALLVLDELAAAASAYPDETQVGLGMILAELYSSLDMHPEAFSALMATFAKFQSVSPNSRAAMLRRSAQIFDRVDRKIDAALSIQDSADLYASLNLIPEAAQLYAELAVRKIGIALEQEPSLALRLLIEARDAAYTSSHLFLQLGRTLEAASQLANHAWMDAQLNQWDAAERSFTHAFELARASAAVEQMVEILDAQTNVRVARGDYEGAQTLREVTQRWAEFAGMEREFAPIEAPAAP